MRYTTDFVWLLYIPAVLVFLQMLEDAKEKKQGKKLLALLSICLVWTFIYLYFIGIQDGNLNYYCPTLYYYLSKIF
jgi:hypothetical protein